VGERGLAEDLFRWAQAHRDGASGHYFTGLVHPAGATFPDAERTSYTGAAIVLTADALAGASPAAQLFVDHDLLPAGLQLPDGGTESRRG
jgi:hypothetical protein